jgi:hypothetical protein
MSDIISFTDDTDLRAVLAEAGKPEYEVIGGDADGFLNPLIVETGAGYVTLKGVGYDTTFLTYSANQLEDLIEVLINAAITSREKEEVTRAAFEALELTEDGTTGIILSADLCCGGGC